jgi:hypothetical protein
MFHQPFQLNEESIAYSTGSYFRTTNWRSLDRTKLIKPSYIQKPAVRYHFDELLFQAFANMIDAHSDDDNCLLRVLEWFNYSCMNVEGFSYYNRIVLLATAYEIFFDLPDYRKEDALATGLERLLDVHPMGLPAIKNRTRLAGKRRIQFTDGGHESFIICDQRSYTAPNLNKQTPLIIAVQIIFLRALRCWNFVSTSYLKQGDTWCTDNQPLK